MKQQLRQQKHHIMADPYRIFCEYEVSVHMDSSSISI